MLSTLFGRPISQRRMTRNLTIPSPPFGILTDSWLPTIWILSTGKYQVLLEKANELVEMLYVAFDTPD
jgi:hypothetical protein